MRFSMKIKKPLISIVRISLLSLLFIFIIMYAHSRTAFLSQGVSLSVENLENGQTIRTRTFTIQGTAKRAVLLTINNRELVIDEEGTFKDIVLLHPGLNVFTIEAYDRFDNYKTITYTVWHETQTTTQNTLEHYKNNHASNTKETQIPEDTPTEESLQENKEDVIIN